MSKVRICKRCKKKYISNNNYLFCPPCREFRKRKTSNCKDCGIVINKRSVRCAECVKNYIKEIFKNKREAEHSEFKEFIRRAKRRKKFDNITPSDLFEVWNRQKGICPYSGVKLKLPDTTAQNNSIETASLDRINSSLPYSVDNVQFISVAMNYMKNTMTHDETINLCKLIAKNWLR